MTPQSAKAKGRKLQQYVRDRILTYFPRLTADDVRSTSMGAGGEDIQLSQMARSYLPVAIECKNRARISIYKDYEQAQNHNPAWEPVLILKQNGSTPLAVINLEHLLSLYRSWNS